MSRIAPFFVIVIVVFAALASDVSLLLALVVATIRPRSFVPFSAFAPFPYSRNEARQLTILSRTGGKERGGKRSTSVAATAGALRCLPLAPLCCSVAPS